MTYRVLYRGQLSSCNYGCDYCPFAKRAETHAQLAADRLGLTQFVTWVAEQSSSRFRILFTPWGEALVRKWYQSAVRALSHEPHVDCVAVQTNLSCDLAWVADCRIDRVAFWATYHPTEVRRERFVAKVIALHRQGVRIGVGAVGLREHFDEIAKLRAELPEAVYVWVNAYKRAPDYYSPADVQFLESVDPHFPINNQYHPSRNEACDAGETGFTVDGDGAIRRCHFVTDPIGSIHAPEWDRCLRPRSCPNTSCGCYIGYVNLPRLNLGTVYGDGLLERIPPPSR